MIVRLLLRWTRRVLVLGVVVSVGAVVLCRILDPPITPLAVIRAGQSIASGRLPGFSRSWRDLDAISPSLVRAVIAAEDEAFFAHHGLDLGAIRRAHAWNARHPDRIPRGASTITMQAARNVFLWPGRSWVRKLLEAWFAMLMELVWGKPRILEVYLNVIEWGDGVYGAEAAARRYFGVPAARLSPRQAALLAAALPHPLRSDPAAPSRYLSARAAAIERRAGRIDLRLLVTRGRGIVFSTLDGRRPGSAAYKTLSRFRGLGATTMKSNGLLALRVLLGLATLGGGIAGAVDPATVSFNSPVFQDHMVLQQGRAVPIWGTGSPVGGELTVSFNGQTKVATVAADHSWRVELDAMTAGGPHVLQVTGHNTLVVEDVLIGEVWLASGQSNMVKQPVQPIDRGGYPLVRFLRNRTWQDNPAETAWHLGRLLYDARQVPIGIINLGAGDTPIREWLGQDALQYLPPEIVAEVGVRIGRFYRQMIAPIAPYAIRGVFWWQGESDYHVTTAFNYGPQLVALIKSWRQVFEQADLPFIFVQLPSGRGPSLRRPSYYLPNFPPDPRYGVDMYDAYVDTLRSVPFTGMVVTKDLGHGPHPYNRVPFAERMVLWARHIAYGDDITYCGPIVESATAEGARVRIRFREGTAKELHGIGPHPPQGFALSEDGQLFDWAKVEIDGSDVVLSNDYMVHPTLVRYGWHEYPRWANLVNDKNMAASPFEIEVGP